MNHLTILIVAIVGAFLTGCSSQTPNSSANVTPAKQLIGGGCDGCELMYVGMPATIPPVDTSAGWREGGQHLLVTGTVYKVDGKTPAAGVIIYYWQTDNNGYYSAVKGMDERVKRHGHIRGWVKTGSNGQYSIYTNRPAPYPHKTMPAHIHISIKEPDINNEYYIDECVFDDDRLLTADKRNKLENRGGSGILRILLNGSLQVAEHNIILGLNIPGYPAPKSTALQSGLPVGEDQPSFTPYHAYGPDKGTRACPVCKYGRYQGILYFVGNHSNWQHITPWLAFLDSECIKRKQYLKAYFVYGSDVNYNKQARYTQLENYGERLKLKSMALTFVPSFTDVTTEVALNKINPLAENTFIIYKNRSIVARFINLQPTRQNFDMIVQTLQNTQGSYFHLQEPSYTH